MDSVDFFEIAEILIFERTLDAASEQSRVRTGISRAYYAAFHCCHADHFGGRKVKKLRHKDFFKTLKSKGGDYVEIERKLRILYVMREKSDYRLNSDISNDDATMSLDLSKEIFDSLPS